MTNEERKIVQKAHDMITELLENRVNDQTLLHLITVLSYTQGLLSVLLEEETPDED